MKSRRLAFVLLVTVAGLPAACGGGGAAAPDGGGGAGGNAPPAETDDDFPLPLAAGLSPTPPMG